MLLCSLSASASPGCTIDLAQALKNWATSTNDTEIRLMQGTYSVSPGSPLIGFSGLLDNSLGGALTIKGGYLTSSCDDSARSKNAALTILDGGGGANSKFSVLFGTSATLSILTFQNYRNNAGVTLIGESSGDTLTVNHVIGKQNSRMYFSGWGETIIEDVLVWGQPGPTTQPALSIYSVDDATRATNLTVVDNAGTGLGLINPFSTDKGGSNPYFTQVYNSIVMNNHPNFDYADSTPNTPPSISGLLTDLGSDCLQCLYDQGSTHLFGKPLSSVFINQPGNNYDLKTVPLSPAINVGTNEPYPISLPGTDIRGATRLTGKTVDLGAYESAVDDHNDFQVTTTTDNGSNTSPTKNSLRWAIQQSNLDPGPSRITFAIPGGCGSLLSIPSNKPFQDITTDITIDGTSQAGWSPNSSYSQFNAKLCISLNGSNSVLHGLHTTSGGRLTVRGLSFIGFTNAAIRLESGKGNIIQGNRIGGTSFLSNTDGVRISGTASYTAVGGPDDPSLINLIIGNTHAGIYIDNAANQNLINTNFIGIAADGVTANGNANGIIVQDSPGNIIIYNTISGNTQSGVLITGSNSTSNALNYNKIGYATDFGTPVPNGLYGVDINALAHNNTVGSHLNSSVGGNAIYGSLPAVYLEASAGTGNSVFANNPLMLATNDPSILAIDAGNFGPTPNGSTPGVQEYPVILNAFATPQMQWIEGILHSAANTTFRVDLYGAFGADDGKCVLPNRGSGFYIGYSTVKTDMGGDVHFWVKQSRLLESFGCGVSATATQLTAGVVSGNTSEIGVPGHETNTDMLFRDDLEGALTNLH